MASNVLVGLVVTAHNNLLLNTSTFDHVSVSAQLPPAAAGVGATAGDRRVSLQWPAVSSANSYLLKRSTTSGGSFALLALPGEATWATGPDARAMVLHWFCGAGATITSSE